MNEDFSKYEELNKPLSSFESAEYRNEWQLCPKCEGAGGWNQYYQKIPKNDNESYTICDLCNGKKIISKINGKPPEL